MYHNPANSPVMRGFEYQVRRVVEAGEVVDYVAVPINKGSDEIAQGMTLMAQGDRGFSLSVTIQNRPG